MHYLESYQFLFRSPKWAMNLLLCTVAQCVPFAGDMVILGYHFDIIEAMHRRGNKDYPDFDFDRLMHYLTRGAWPFLVQLVVALPLVALVVVVYFVFLIGILTIIGSKGNPSLLIPWLVLGGCAFLLCVFVGFVAALFLLPMTLRSGLMMDFKAGFSSPFIRDFLRRMWGPALLAELFLYVTGMVVMLAGMLLFLVGAYPAQALIRFARAYLLYELYEEYLRRGGSEIPLPAKTKSSAGYPDYDDEE